MELQKLKALAQDVKQWGSCDSAWFDTSEDEPAAVVGHISEDGETYPVAVIDCDQYYADQDSLKLARFYAAANPAAILELIERVEELETATGILKDIGDFAHDRSTGPAVPDDLWEVRRLAYSAL